MWIKVYASARGPSLSFYTVRNSCAMSIALSRGGANPPSSVLAPPI